MTSPPKFAGGTVLDGPAHTHGGVQMFGTNGHYFGNAEGGEAIINKRSTALFLPLLSHLNQLGGGRALLPAAQAFPHMRFGGMTAPMIRETMAGPSSPPIDYARLGASVAEALRKNPPVNKWSDFKAAEGRAKYTDSLSSF